MFLSVLRKKFSLFSTQKQLQPKNKYYDHLLRPVTTEKQILRVIVKEAQSINFEYETNSSHITNTVCDLMHRLIYGW